ncbi:MAG: peptidoglycan editing factor PgeF [Comamonadaceae bacterium]
MVEELAALMDWLIPDWPAPAQVRAMCTTRVGGISKVPFDSLNLGDHVGDSQAAVAANRILLQEAMDARPHFLAQVHGTHCVTLTDATAMGVEADGCITSQPRLACSVMAADCLPVLLADARGSVVAAAHAGWRGLAGQAGHGILESVLASLDHVRCTVGMADRSDILVWLGPCIGSQAFEVGADVRNAFVTQTPAAAAMFLEMPGDKWLADLQGLARLRLRALGVKRIYGNDGTRSWCTVSHPEQFFSYRRDRVCGRMAACIWLA